MALSGRGLELWPPRLRTVKGYIEKVFSAVCKVKPSGLPPAAKPPPPPSELSANSASVHLRHSVAPRRAPLPLVSSSPVNNMTMSRGGLRAGARRLGQG